MDLNLLKVNVLHVPTTVGGNPQGMSRALQKIGLNSVSITLEQNYFEYAADKVLWKKKDGIVMRNVKRFALILFGYPNYDIIHFNFGSTVAPSYPVPSWSGFGNFFRWLVRYGYAKYCELCLRAELLYLRALGKVLVITYQGSDARQWDYCLRNFKISMATQLDSNYCHQDSDNYKRHRIKLLSRYCKKVYSLNPDLMHVLPGSAEFIPYSHISLEEWKPNYTQLEDRPLRIVHAPSNRRLKGTDLILKALDELKEQGVRFELLLVENLSNAEAKKIYQSADILIDQIFAGWYGGLAVELMALGKPVIVYIRDEDLKFIPKEMELDMPLIRTTPETIKEVVLQTLLMPRDELIMLAKNSREYVEKWHDPIRIAKKIKLDYLALFNIHPE